MPGTDLAEFLYCVVGTCNGSTLETRFEGSISASKCIFITEAWFTYSNPDREELHANMAVILTVVQSKAVGMGDTTR